MADRRTIEQVRRHRDTMSVRELSRSLGIPKREVLDILKHLDREGADSSPIPAQRTFFDRLRNLSDRFFSSKAAPSAALFVIALSVRLGFLVATYEDPLVQTPILDGAYYLEWGEEIANGTQVADDAYFVEPGYAYLVALSIKLFSSFLPLIPLQLLLGSLAIVLIYLTSVRATGRRGASFLAALLAACSAPLVFHDALLLKTSVEFFLLSLSVYALAYAWDAPLARAFLPVGLALGLTAAVKANVFYTVPLIVGAIFLATVRAEYATALRKSALLVLGVALVLSPIAIRNFMKSGSFVPINASGGPNLYIGNWEGADGSLKPPEFVSVNPESEEESWKKIAESYEHRILTLPEVSSFWTGETIRQIVGDPGFFLGITAKKVLLLFHHVPLADNADESYAHGIFPPLRFLVPFWIPAILGLVGIAFALFSREKRRFLPYAAIVFGYAGTLAIGHVSERYRLSLLPALLVFVAFLFAWITDRIAARKWTSLAVTSVAIFFLAVLAFLPVTVSGTSPADMYANFGSKAEAEGDAERARSLYERGLAADPLHIPSLQKLARLALLDGDFDRSIALSRASMLRQWELPGDMLALALDAKAKNLSREEIRTRLDTLGNDADDASYDADYLEAMKRFRRQEYEEAIPYFERALGRYPKSETVTANLATAHKNGGNPDQGEKLLRRVIERNPANLPARFNLGNYYMQKKDYFAAIREYGAINDLVPGYHLSRFYLGEAYAKAGDTARAIDAYRTFIEESRDWPEKAGVARQAEQLISGLEKKRALPGAEQPTE